MRVLFRAAGQVGLGVTFRLQMRVNRMIDNRENSEKVNQQACAQLESGVLGIWIRDNLQCSPCARWKPTSCGA
jgi:hypothetical protein